MTEYFDVVDENDNVIGLASRDVCHEKGLWHRAVHIIIVNSKSELLLQKRSMKKDLYKGYWIDAAAGHVDCGESYESAAKRELAEELGINIELIHIIDFKKYTGNDNEFINVFFGRHDGPFDVDKEEVDFVEFFSIEKIKKMMQKENFTPTTIEIFDIIEKNPGILKSLKI